MGRKQLWLGTTELGVETHGSKLLENTQPQPKQLSLSTYTSKILHTPTYKQEKHRLGGSGGGDWNIDT